MRLGDADAERLKLLGRFYDPNSAAFIESAGVATGDSIADLGCGHGAITDRIAARVGDTGTVYAVDASAPTVARCCCRSPMSAACIFCPALMKATSGAPGGMRWADHAARPTTSLTVSRNCSTKPALPSTVATATSPLLARRKPSSFTLWDSTSVHRLSERNRRSR